MISSESPHPLFSLFSVLSLVIIFSVKSKELELELEQPKKKVAIPVFIIELGQYIKKFFLINMSTWKVNCYPRCVT